MQKIRKDDTVILLAGKDKGKQGQVLKIYKNDRVLISGLNIVKKHVKPNPQKNEQGGIVDKEMPVHISNVAIFNTVTNKIDKIRFKILEDGKKTRIFKSTNEAISS